MFLLFQIFELMFKKLTKLNTEFAGRLLFALKCRILERRHKIVSTLLAYLEDPNFLETTEGKELAYADHGEIANEAARILVRLFPTPVNEARDEEDPDDPELVVVETAAPPVRSDSDDFKDVAYKHEPTAPQCVRSTTPLEVIERAMSEYETSGERPTSLQKVYLALLSVPPTSCEAER